MKLFLLLVLLPLFSFAEEVKLLTWNVYMIPRPAKFTAQAVRSPMISRALILQDADVVLLQETFSGGFRKSLTKIAGNHYPYTQTLSGSGVMIMSRLPMKLLGSVTYKECLKGDCWAKKGALLMEVTLNSGRTFQIASTHLQAGGGEDKQKIRVTQIQQIKDLLVKFKVEGVPQILAGDLNIEAFKGNEFAKTLQSLQMTSLVDSRFPVSSKATNIGCYDSRDSSDRNGLIDHILLGNQKSTTYLDHMNVEVFEGPFKGKSCDLSDHHGVSAVLNL